jgi:hypothetical protein
MSENEVPQDTKKWKKWLHHYATVFTGVGTILLAVIGALGLFLVLNELSELRKQNSYLESSLKQTYRPLGYACSNPRSPDSILVIMGWTSKSLDRFSFKIDYTIFNHGQGVLCYIGSFFYAATKPIEFRQQLMDGELDSVNVDSRYPFNRLETILPYNKSNVSKTGATVIFDRIPFADRYFVYTLLLYEDQDGNLYDTEHLQVLSFEQPRIERQKVEIDLDKTGPSSSQEIYHAYSIEGRKKLAKAIRNLRYPKNHPLAYFIEGLK